MYKIGDLITVSIASTPFGWLRQITAEEEDVFKYTTRHKVEIVGKDFSDEEFICLCDFDPHSYFAHEIVDYHLQVYDVAKYHLGKRCCYVYPNMIIEKKDTKPAPQLKLKDPGGMACKICNKFIQYAGPNRDDLTFVCYNCRCSRAWKLKHCNPL